MTFTFAQTCITQMYLRLTVNVTNLPDIKVKWFGISKNEHKSIKRDKSKWILSILEEGRSVNIKLEVGCGF